MKYDLKKMLLEIQQDEEISSLGARKHVLSRKEISDMVKKAKKKGKPS